MNQSGESSPTALDAVGEDLLLATVDRLRDELDGMRAAMRSRAVIEQAKGMLMERHGCSADEAFDRLAQFSQRANVKLVDVASALVAASGPEQPAGRRPAAPLGRRTPGRSAGAAAAPAATMSSGTPPSTPPGTPPGMSASMSPSTRAAAQPAAEAPVGRPTAGAAARVTPGDVAAAARRRQAEHWPRQGGPDSAFATQVRRRGQVERLRSALAAAEDGQQMLDAVLATVLAENPPDGAILASADVSGALVLLGFHGIPADVAVRWHRIPIDVALPVCEVARTGQPVHLEATREQPGRRGPDLGFGLSHDWTVAMAVALRHPGGASGVLALTWADGASAPPAQDVHAAARELARSLPRQAPNPPLPPTLQAAAVDPEFALLDVMLGPVLLCAPVTGADRTVSGLDVRHANPPAAAAVRRPAGELSGRSLIELFPDTATNGVLAACLRVWETGQSIDLDDVRTRPQAPPGPCGRVRVTRYRDGVLVTWGNGSGGAS